MATRKPKRYDEGGDIPQTDEEAANEAALNADLPRRRMMDAAMAEGAKDEKAYSGPATAPEASVSKRSVPSTPKVAPTPARKPMPSRANQNYSNEGRAAAAQSRENYGNEGRGDAKYLKRTMTPESQALEASHPEQYLMPGAGIKSVAALAKAAANRGAGASRTITQGALTNAPTRQIPYDKAGMLAKQRAARAEGRNSEMLSENARRSGVTPGSAGATAMRKNLGGDDWTLGMKRGGSVSSASSRGDGIATKGKTRGTMVMCGGGMAKGKK